MSRSAPSSRLPLSNRADRQNDTLTAHNVRLSEREGEELREEVTFDTLAGVEAVTTSEGIDRFEAWYDDQRDSKIVVENQRGERTGFSTPNRFTPEYREMQYASVQSLERSLREQWGGLLHTVMVTLTCSTTDDQGRPRPLVDHYRDLDSSWDAVRRAVSRVLDGREWEYVGILEPTSSGYVHIHLGLFVKGPVVAEQFQPVLDAHLKNCDGAGDEAHQIHPSGSAESAVRVNQVGRRENGGVENLGAYLAAYMAGEYGSEATEMPENVKAFYSVMWATGAQWFRASNGAQEYMKPDDDGASEESEERWRLLGFSPSGDIENDVVDLEPGSGGGATFRVLGRCLDPPSE